MNILVINSGSSSLKYQVLEMPDERVVASGRIERIGESGGKALLTIKGSEAVELDCLNHRDALERVFEYLEPGSIDAVGHRVVHGKDVFLEPTIADTGAMAKMRDLIELAPLHMPANVNCIDACRELLPETPQVAYFDTSFYRTMPRHARLYPAPLEWSEKHGVRRYGFHGTSHHFVTLAAAEMLGIEYDRLRVITAHLGAGSSITAFRDGAVADTSMGFTPLEGLMMATRAGYFDVAAVPYIMDKTGLSLEQVVKSLNTESGLVAVGGVGRDMRDILDAMYEGNERAELAFRMFTHTLQKYVGGYFFVVGGAHAMVFTGGIGENSPEVRKAVFEGLEQPRITIDDDANKSMTGGRAGEISTPDSVAKVLVIPTNEELMIARETYKLLA